MTRFRHVDFSPVCIVVFTGLLENAVARNLKATRSVGWGLDAPVLFPSIPGFVCGHGQSFSVAGDERRSNAAPLQFFATVPRLPDRKARGFQSCEFLYCMFVDQFLANSGQPSRRS